MKAIFVGLLLFLYGGWAAAETYKVIFVQGTIIRQKTGAPLKVGEEIDKTEALEYKSADASAHAFNPEFGRITLGKNGATLAASGGERESTRPMGLPSGTYLILDFAAQDFDPEKCEPSKGKLVYQYEYNGKKNERKLETRENQIILKKSALYPEGVDYAQVKNAHIVYEDPNGSVIRLSYFPVFADGQKLQNEVQMIVNDSRRIGKDDRYILEQTFQYLTGAYAKTDTTNVLEWMDHVFDVRHRHDFEAGLGNPKLAILGDRLEMNVDPVFLPNIKLGLSKDALDHQDINVIFTYKGQKIEKTLNETNRNKLTLDKNSFYTDENGAQIDPTQVQDIKLIYYTKKDEPVLICRINPNFVSEERAKKVVDSAISSLKDSGKDAQSQKEAVIQELITNFGGVFRPNVESWLRQNYNL